MLLNFEHISKNYGERQILDDVTFYMNPGDRIGVVSVNGGGKSTLLRIAAGRDLPDSGAVSTDPNVRIGYLSQIPEDDPEKTLIDQVLSGQDPTARELAEYEAVEILTRLGLPDVHRKIKELSGGQRKRAALAQCLVSPADLLILDEPTNHLDIAMIRWLEEYLDRFKGGILFVTHDRYFLEHVAQQTAEVAFGHVYFTPGGYSEWLDARARREEMEAAGERKRQSTLRRELIWVLQGPCARGTKSRDRLERYEALKAKQPPEVRQELGEITTVSSRLGKKTIELEQVTRFYGDRQILQPFDFRLLRDDRVGIVGLNGAGKSTLLDILAGRAAPDSGRAEFGETVKIGYFTQHSDELDPRDTALEYVRSKGNRIETEDGALTASKLMELFLFSGDMQYRRIGDLSGGERRRLFLLGILASAPNVLILDEPTNDLDIPTLQVLENYLQTFGGAVIAVSHDRYFLDRVCRRVLVVQEGKPIREFTGGYTDYYELEIANEPKPEKQPKERSAPKSAPKPKQQKLKFSYKERLEYEHIDEDIAALEADIASVEEEQTLYGSDYVKLQELEEKKNSLEAQLEEKMDRWVYLNELAEKIAEQDG